MPIVGRSQPLPAIISRSDPRDFATVNNPVTTVVVAPPYPRIWFKGPQAIVVVDNPATFAATNNPVTTVVVATPYARTWFNGPQADISQAPFIPVITGVATPAPIVVTPMPPIPKIPEVIYTAGNNPATFATTSAQPTVVVPANRAQLIPEPIISQAPLIQAAPVTPAQPLVVTSPQRPGLATPVILSRSPQAPLPLATVGIPAPIVYTPTVPRVRLYGTTVIWFPRGTTNPLPPPGDLDVCIQGPITSWIMGDVFTNTCEASAPITIWFVGTSFTDCESPIVGTNWIMQAPVEDC